MEIVQVPLTSRADAVTVKHSTAVKFCIFNVNDYHQAELFARIDHIDDPDIPLRDASLSPVPSLRDSFGIYGFEYLHCTS